MSAVEPILVILLTNGRTDYALRTVDSACEHLIYPNLYWYIADGGNRGENFEIVKNRLIHNDARIWGFHSTPEYPSYGKDANLAWNKSIDLTRLTMWLEDDWELRQTLDLRPYADLLMDREEFGMVRLGYLNVGMVGKTIGHGGHLYWWLHRDSDEAYVFTGHPSLRHWRFRHAYGPYTEGRRPGETELDMAWQFRTKPGPGILWPADIGPYGPFGHIGERQSYE
jgi:hypothetical protein